MKKAQRNPRHVIIHRVVFYRGKAEPALLWVTQPEGHAELFKIAGVLEGTKARSVSFVVEEKSCVTSP